MNNYCVLYDMADAIFDTGQIYWWTMRGAAIWACKPVAPGPNLTQ